jgi:hypothetical protein
LLSVFEEKKRKEKRDIAPSPFVLSRGTRADSIFHADPDIPLNSKEEEIRPVDQTRKLVFKGSGRICSFFFFFFSATHFPAPP